MADAAAEFYDPTTGILQVSAGLLGFVCRRSGTGTTRSRITGNTAPSSLEVNIAGYSRPMVAIHIADYAAAYAGSTSSGDGQFNNAAFACSAPVGIGFTYYIFEWTRDVPANNGLMQLFTLDGRCSFSSAQWPMKIVARISMSQFGGDFTYTSAPGKMLATACAGMGGHSIPNGTYCSDGGRPPGIDGNLEGCQNVVGNIDGKLYGGKVSSGGRVGEGALVSYDDVTASFGTYENFQQYGENGWQVLNQILVVDVTNIPIGRTFF